MKLFIIDQNRPERTISLLALLLIPQTLLLLFYLIFTLQILAESIFAYFFGLAAFIGYTICVIWENRDHSGCRLIVVAIVHTFFILIEFMILGSSYKNPSENPQAGYFETCFMYFAVCYLTGLFVIPILLIFFSVFIFFLCQNWSPFKITLFIIEVFLVSYLAILCYQVFAGPSGAGLNLEILFIYFLVLMVILQVAVLLKRETTFNMIKGLFHAEHLPNFSETESTLLVFYYIFLLLGIILIFWFVQEDAIAVILQKEDSFAQLAIGYYIVFSVFVSTALIGVCIGGVGGLLSLEILERRRIDALGGEIKYP